MSAASTRKPGRPKDPDRERRRREEILTAAATVFAQHGYAATDVQVIADTLQVGKGTIYRYFPTKRDLFLAAVDRGLKDLDDTVTGILTARDVDPIELVRYAIRAYLKFFHDRPEMAELFIQERAAFRDRHTPLYFSSGYDKQSRDEPFVRALIAAGRLREMNPKRLMMVTGDLLYGTIISNHLSGRPSSPNAQADAILDILFHGILSERERKRHKGRPL
jgi:AcrR family transcriptional regulator